MGEPAFEMNTNHFDEARNFLCEIATFTWDLFGYMYKYMDETEFKF